MKKAIVIYDTKFGNTQRIAEALTQGMRDPELTVDCVNIEEVKVDKLIEYDVFAIGGPTHSFGISKSMKEFIQKLEKIALKDKTAFAFDTKYGSRFAGSAGKTIEKRLKKFGMNIIKQHSSAIVQGSEGPLDDGMEERFKQIGIEIKENVLNEIK